MPASASPPQRDGRRRSHLDDLAAASPLSGPDDERWRARALDLLLWTALGLGTAALLFAVLGAPGGVPPWAPACGLGFLLVVAALALAPKAPYAVRAWGALLILLGLGGQTLAATGLEGSGRLFLGGVPLLASVLLGPRRGYVAAALSLGLFGGEAWLIVLGPWRAPLLARGANVDGRFWLLQGLLLALVQGPVLVLVNRFIDHVREVLAEERQAEHERRRLEQALQESAERERREVGIQLHDGPCQGITAASLRCQVIRESLRARGSGCEIAQLDALAAFLDTSLKEIHDLARGLAQKEVTPENLSTALDDLAEGARASAGIECDLLHDGLARPETPERATHLYWIAHEAVRNAVRHGKPGRIEIELARTDTVLRLRVQDDGSGMPEHGSRDGMGLRIMRQRAALIGGSLDVAPAAGGGTVVTCTVPALPLEAVRGSPS